MQHVPGARDARTTGRGGPFASDEGVARLVEQAGFQGVHTVSATVPVRFDDAGHWYRWSWSVAQRQAWEALPEADRPAVRASLQELVEQARLPDGARGYDQVARGTLAVR